MAVTKKRKTTTSKTATKAKAGRPKTKKFNQSAETGKIVSPKAVETDKKSTVTQTVLQDNDGVRSDKGTKRQPKPAQTVERTQSEPALTEQGAKQFIEDVGAAKENFEPLGAEEGQTFTGVPELEESTDPLPCLTDRPNKPKSFTCLDEVKEAIEKPQNYSEAQLSDIFSDNNLCANCKANQEASE